MGIKVVFVISILFLAASGCVQTPHKKEARQDERLDYLAKQTQDKIHKEEMSRISRDIARMKLKELKELDSPQRRPMPNPLNEDNLYAEALKQYHKGDVRGLRFYQAELVRRYPKSVHIDNVLLLVGRLHRKQKRPAYALRYLQNIIDGHPLSNKRPAAMLEKGVIYSELNLKPQALLVFQQLEKEYPGSPESMRVIMEKRLLQVK